MKILLIRICVFFATLVSFAAPAYAAQSVIVDTGKVNASLVSSHDRAAPGQTFYIALHTELDAGWHTYWRNPGDSGEPVQMQWRLPEAMAAQAERIASLGEDAIFWPLPRPIPTGPLINYGFEGSPIFPVEFTMPETAKAGDVLTFTVDFYYLVCADVCIPENGSVDIFIGVSASSQDAALDALWGPVIQRALDFSPKMIKAAAGIAKPENLHLDFAQLPEGDYSKSYFFPYTQGVIIPSAPQAVRLGTQGTGGAQSLRLETSADYLWDEEITSPSFSGVLTYQLDEQYRGVVVDLAVNAQIDTGELSPRVGANTGIDAQAGGDVASAGVSKNLSGSGITLWGAIIGAFLGGIILNLMPCVFPIISLKALSLARSAHSDIKAVRAGAWAYTGGVLVCFAVLAVILIVLKGAGEQIGWGFQLQSPIIVGILAVLLFVIGLNLLGAFEFGSRLQNTGAGLTEKTGLKGSFFTGALAVIVATPCTAPFMAGAMGYALAQPAGVMLLVFLALGLGFALPFLCLGYAPKLMARLPRPGPWMVRFKELLAFPMLAASIWLVWVLSLQAGDAGVLVVLSAALLIAFAIWLFGRRALWIKGAGFAALLGAAALLFTLQTAQSAGAASIGTQSWSQQAVEQNLSEGRNVFVDFTAAWCVTCKVNERLVLKTEDVQDMFAETNTAFLIADWTNKNDIIAAELERYGRAGVPLYLVFTPDGGPQNATILPQVLTYDIIKDALFK